MSVTGDASEPPAEPQTTGRVLMIRPAAFGANPETAATNAFQRGAEGSAAELLARARAEFDGLVAALRAHGVDVLVLEDEPEPPRPDAVFPNNWVSFHADGRVVLYPMLAPSRRAEVRAGLLGELARLGLSGPRRVLDLRVDAGGEALEGTGSLVLDRAGRVAYACRSPRTSARLLARFCAELGYQAVAFDALDARGVPIYHTNVMMALGEGFALVCAEAIPDEEERARVRAHLAAGGRELVPLTWAQMDEFAGNALALRAGDGRQLLVLSARARRALTPAQLAVLERHATLVSAELATIEACGGGSARCMIAEVF
ncbi:MAG TPA: arginine deiminase-related protein [Planctomycetota bacterium]